jgi:hypothetical protein
VVDLAVLTAAGKCFGEIIGDAMLTLTEETSLRLQVKLVSSRERRLRVILGVLSFLLVAAAFLVLPLQAVIDGSQLPGDISPVAAFVGAVLVSAVFSLAVTLAFAQVLRDKLVLVDRTPTGDDVLN